MHWFFLLVFPDSLGNFEETVSEAFVMECSGLTGIRVRLQSWAWA